MSISPLYHDEEIVGATCVARDVTERKKLESKLIQAQKMESIGTLAGGVAHDFNNLLMGIQGYTSLMLLDLDAIHPHYARLKSIEEQVRSGADLTKQLLGFARGGKYQVTTIDLNDVIEKSSVMFGRTKKEISIHCNLDSNLWPVEADRGQIEQALLNLYVNAWQAMPGGGKLYIDTQNIIIGDNYVSTFTIEPGNYIKISVTDTGLGMDDKTIERIFDPFFTTKEMGRGTGLGLASVYGIIKGHRGMIKVYSEKGHGTTFTIYLPSSTKNVMPEKELHSVEETLRGHETILLVDDEEVILDVSKAILENLGYRIISSDKGEEAIKIYKTDPNKIDLVILDMILPGMSGMETFDRLKEINPNIKVILSSGYSLNGNARNLINKGCRAFIQKPFSISAISSTIRRVLDEDEK